MPSSADTLRRWFGLLFLALAFGMLLWGQIVLRDTLRGLALLVYWGVCFLLTLAAIVVALLDLRATRRQAVKEQRELLHRTLEEIEADKEDLGPKAE